MTRTIARFGYRHEAEYAQGFLLDAGIPSSVFVDDAGGAEMGMAFSNPARLVVAAENGDRARDVLLHADPGGVNAPGAAGSGVRGLIGYPQFLRSSLLRVVVLWGGVRLASLLAGADLSGVRVALAIGLVVSALVMIDARAIRELQQMRNLGLPPAWHIAVALVTTALLETGLRLVW